MNLLRKIAVTVFAVPTVFAFQSHSAEAEAPARSLAPYFAPATVTLSPLCGTTVN